MPSNKVKAKTMFDALVEGVISRDEVDIDFVDTYIALLSGKSKTPVLTRNEVLEDVMREVERFERGRAPGIAKQALNEGARFRAVPRGADIPLSPAPNALGLSGEVPVEEARGAVPRIDKGPPAIGERRAGFGARGATKTDDVVQQAAKQMGLSSSAKEAIAKGNKSGVLEAAKKAGKMPAFLKTVFRIGGPVALVLTVMDLFSRAASSEEANQLTGVMTGLGMGPLIERGLMLRRGEEEVERTGQIASAAEFGASQARQGRMRDLDYLLGSSDRASLGAISQPPAPSPLDAIVGP